MHNLSDSFSFNCITALYRPLIKLSLMHVDTVAISISDYFHVVLMQLFQKIDSSKTNPKLCWHIRQCDKLFHAHS